MEKRFSTARGQQPLTTIESAPSATRLVAQAAMQDTVGKIHPLISLIKQKLIVWYVMIPQEPIKKLHREPECLKKKLT
jgi:hypothetical protein